MKQQHFQLVIKPGFEGAVRFAQLYSYAENLKAGEEAIMAPALLEYISIRLTDHESPITIANFFRDHFNGWRIKTNSAHDKDNLVIVTEGAGIKACHLFELIEQFLPEALGQQIFYEPVDYRRPSQYDLYLH